MRRSRLTVFLLITLFAASALTVTSPVDGLTTLPPSPDFQIQISNIAYNVTALNSTLPNGNTTLVFYNRAELEISFNVEDAVQYINDGYSLFYDVRYKDHFEPEWFARWHTIFDEDEYPNQLGTNGITTNCTIMYPSDDALLDFQARTIAAKLVTHWHYERVQGKWTRVNQTVMEAVTSSEWTNIQTLSGLDGYFPKTITPSTSPSPSPSPVPTNSKSLANLDEVPLGWMQLAVMAAVGIAGGVIVLWGIYVWRRSNVKKPNRFEA